MSQDLLAIRAIQGEIATASRRISSHIKRHEPFRPLTDKEWLTHHQHLATIPGSEQATALATEAWTHFDRFNELQPDGLRKDLDEWFLLASETGKQAVDALRQLDQQLDPPLNYGNPAQENP